MLLLYLALTVWSIDDPPKAKDPTDSPARALERFEIAAREGSLEKMAAILAKATRKPLERRIAAEAAAAKLEKQFDDALTEKFGKDEAPRQVETRRDPSSKDPDFAVKVLKEAELNPGRIKLKVLSGRKLPLGEIDGREQEMHAVLEDGSWKLEIPELVKGEELLTLAEDLWASVTEQRQRIVTAVKDGKYASRQEARRAWSDVMPNLTKLRPRQVAPPVNRDKLLAKKGDGLLVLPDPVAKPRARVEFRRAEKLSADGLVRMIVPGDDNPVFVHARADLTTEDISTATVAIDINRDAVLEIVFTPKGAEKAAILSKEHLGKPVAFLVDGKLVVAPKIMSKVNDRIVLTGKWSKADVEQLARSINGTP